MSESSAYTVPALEKGIKILEDLSASAEPLSISELATNQGKGRNEIYRMLCSLESLGYITREESTKRYRLTLKLFQLANRYPFLERVQRMAEEPMQALANRINESCHLCVLYGSDLSVVSQASGNERLRICFQLGARFDPLETCSGKLLLSEMEPFEREKVLESSALWQKATTSEKMAYEKAFANVPQNRIWEQDSNLRRGVLDISVALGSPKSFHATLAIAHVADYSNPTLVKDIRKYAVRTAREIENRLGLNP